MACTGRDLPGWRTAASGGEGRSTPPFTCPVVQTLKRVHGFLAHRHACSGESFGRVFGYLFAILRTPPCLGVLGLLRGRRRYRLRVNLVAPWPFMVDQAVDEAVEALQNDVCLVFRHLTASHRLVQVLFDRRREELFQFLPRDACILRETGMALSGENFLLKFLGGEAKECRDVTDKLQATGPIERPRLAVRWRDHVAGADADLPEYLTGVVGRTLVRERSNGQIDRVNVHHLRSGEIAQRVRVPGRQAAAGPPVLPRRAASSTCRRSPARRRLACDRT